MIYSKSISRRKLALLTALGLVASLFFGLTTASHAQPVSCTLTPEDPEDAVGTSGETGGTSIIFTLVCEGRPQTTTLEVSLDVGDVLVFKDVDVVTFNGGKLRVSKEIHLPPPPQPPPANLCIKVDGKEVVPGTCPTPPPA